MRPHETYCPQNRLTQLEDTVLSLIFEIMKERRYSRTTEEYAAIATRLPPIKVLHGRVNDRLKQIAELRATPRLCHFQAREQHRVVQGLFGLDQSPSCTLCTCKSGLRTKQERRPRAVRVQISCKPRRP